MGIKEGESDGASKAEGGSASGNNGTSSGPGEASKLAQKQDELFRKLDQQYAVARLQTHTQRGTGLGFNS